MGLISNYTGSRAMTRKNAIRRRGQARHLEKPARNFQNGNEVRKKPDATDSRKTPPRNSNDSHVLAKEHQDVKKKDNEHSQHQDVKKKDNEHSQHQDVKKKDNEHSQHQDVKKKDNEHSQHQDVKKKNNEHSQHHNDKKKHTDLKKKDLSMKKKTSADKPKNDKPTICEARQQKSGSLTDKIVSVWRYAKKFMGFFNAPLIETSEDKKQPKKHNTTSAQQIKTSGVKRKHSKHLKKNSSSSQHNSKHETPKKICKVENVTLCVPGSKAKNKQSKVKVILNNDVAESTCRPVLNGANETLFEEIKNTVISIPKESIPVQQRTSSTKKVVRPNITPTDVTKKAPAKEHLNSDKIQSAAKEHKHRGKKRHHHCHKRTHHEDTERHSRHRRHHTCKRHHHRSKAIKIHYIQKRKCSTCKGYISTDTRHQQKYNHHKETCSHGCHREKCSVCKKRVTCLYHHNKRNHYLLNTTYFDEKPMQPSEYIEIKSTSSAVYVLKNCLKENELNTTDTESSENSSDSSDDSTLFSTRHARRNISSMSVSGSDIDSMYDKTGISKVLGWWCTHYALNAVREDRFVRQMRIHSDGIKLNEPLIIPFEEYCCITTVDNLKTDSNPNSAFNSSLSTILNTIDDTSDDTSDDASSVFPKTLSSSYVESVEELNSDLSTNSSMMNVERLTNTPVSSTENLEDCEK